MLKSGCNSEPSRRGLWSGYWPMVVPCATGVHRYTSSTGRGERSSSERLVPNAMARWKTDSTHTLWSQTTAGYSRSDGVTGVSNGRPQDLSHGGVLVGVLGETASGSHRLDRCPSGRISCRMKKPSGISSLRPPICKRSGSFHNLWRSSYSCAGEIDGWCARPGKRS